MDPEKLLKMVTKRITVINLLIEIATAFLKCGYNMCYSDVSKRDK